MTNFANESLTREEVRGFKDLLKALDELPQKPLRKTFEEYLQEQGSPPR